MLETTTDHAFCPPIETSVLRTQKGIDVLVVRDDILTGGTKQRALLPFLAQLPSREFVYASPFSGYAQIALAHVSAYLGRTCVIIAETDPGTRNLHPYSVRARDLGAKVYPVRNLVEAEEVAEVLASERTRMIKIPLGFDVPGFRHSMASVLRREWEALVRRMPGGVKRLWIPVGSGTLATSFLSFLPETVEVTGVNVRVLRDEDERLRKLEPLMELEKAPMPFRDPAKVLPEIPSNLYYDAKIWAFLEEKAQPGDVWWNVAG